MEQPWRPQRTRIAACCDAVYALKWRMVVAHATAINDGCWFPMCIVLLRQLQHSPDVELNRTPVGDVVAGVRQTQQLETNAIFMQ